MATAVEGIRTYHLPVHNTAIADVAATANDSSSSGGDSASISANDFLTLLVTEMRNQDPTANTDPNEYINQLVQVNSLEQLISINQTLNADSKGTESNTGAISSGAFPRANETNPSVTPALHQIGIADRPANSAPEEKVSGNLAVPAVNLAARRVSLSLGNR